MAIINDRLDDVVECDYSTSEEEDGGSTQPGQLSIATHGGTTTASQKSSESTDIDSGSEAEGAHDRSGGGDALCELGFRRTVPFSQG